MKKLFFVQVWPTSWSRSTKHCAFSIANALTQSEEKKNRKKNSVKWRETDSIAKTRGDACEPNAPTSPLLSAIKTRNSSQNTGRINDNRETHRWNNTACFCYLGGKMQKKTPPKTVEKTLAPLLKLLKDRVSRKPWRHSSNLQRTGCREKWPLNLVVSYGRR